MIEWKNGDYRFYWLTGDFINKAYLIRRDLVAKILMIIVISRPWFILDIEGVFTLINLASTLENLFLHTG